MNLLCSQQRKTIGQVETHLITEHTLSPDTRPVVFYHSILPDMTE